VLDYLENPYLMNRVPASVNTASFTAAAGALAGYTCGFAQLEAADGLALLQHIKQLCHSVRSGRPQSRTPEQEPVIGGNSSAGGGSWFALNSEAS
jgi:hypothetical protein